MATFGEIQIGRIALREDSLVSLSPDEFGSSRIRIVGQESVPRISLEAIKQRVDDVIGLNLRMLPVQFSHKPELNGYYVIESVSASYDYWHGHNVAVLPWDITMSRIGYDSEIDIEARLSGPITKANDFAATGQRWTAPPVGHYSFLVPGAMPPVTARGTIDGEIKVYRSLSQTANPRYGCDVSNYLKGRVRLIDGSGLERTSVSLKISPAGWQFHNGLIKIEPGISTTFKLSYWIDNAWQSREFAISDDDGVIFEFNSISVLKNDIESCTIRLMKDRSTGRRTIDLTLKRGSIFVEGYYQRSNSGAMSVGLDSGQPVTQTQGYLVTDTSDSNGVKYIIGSLKNFTVDLQGKISKSGSVAMDFFLGAFHGYSEIAPNSNFTSNVSGWEGLTGTNLTWSGGSAIATSTGLANPTGIQTTGNGYDSGSSGGIYGWHLLKADLNSSVNMPDCKMHIDWLDNSGGLIYTTTANLGAVNSGPRSISSEHLAATAAQYADIRISAGSIASGATVAFDRISLNKYNPGDRPSDIYAQYLGSPAEFIQGVRR